MARISLVCIIIIICIGFCKTAYSVEQVVDKYQIVASPDGNTYRLDKSSGKVCLINGDKMKEVSTEDFRLTIGQRYQGDDGYFFIYSGKGQFTEVKSLNDVLNEGWK